MNHDPVNSIANQIVSLIKPIKIILFGSFARRENTAASDLDLLIILPDGTHKRKTAQYLYQKIESNGYAFDLIIATPSDLKNYGDTIGLIYRNALKEGREIYAA